MKEYYGKRFFETDAELLDPRHTAFIVVDLQNDMVHPEGVFGPNPIERIVPSAAQLVDEAHSRGVLVTWLRNTVLPGGRSDSPAWLSYRSRHGVTLDYTVKGTWGHALLDGLAPGPDDVLVDKHRSSGFVGTDLDTILRSNGIETVVVCGCMTEGCVESTVRHAAFLDYYPVVVEDVVASNTPALHDASLTVMRSQFRVLSASEIVASWPRAS